MTRKEKIIEVKGKISQAVADDRISQRCAIEIMNDIDAILSLPIDVPSEEEINEYAEKEVNRQRSGFVAMNNELPITLNSWLNTLKHSKRITAKWAINEILKRNGKVL